MRILRYFAVLLTFLGTVLTGCGPEGAPKNPMRAVEGFPYQNPEEGKPVTLNRAVPKPTMTGVRSTGTPAANTTASYVEFANPSFQLDVKSRTVELTVTRTIHSKTEQIDTIKLSGTIGEDGRGELLDTEPTALANGEKTYRLIALVECLDDQTDASRLKCSELYVNIHYRSGEKLEREQFTLINDKQDVDQHNIKSESTTTVVVQDGANTDNSSGNAPSGTVDPNAAPATDAADTDHSSAEANDATASSAGEETEDPDTERAGEFVGQEPEEELLKNLQPTASVVTTPPANPEPQPAVNRPKPKPLPTEIVVGNLALSISGPQAWGFYTAGRMTANGDLIDTDNGRVKPMGQKGRDYGTEYLTDFIEQASAEFLSEHGECGKAILVTDLSLKRGGKIKGHGSHQNGLDADIAYLPQDKFTSATDAKGRLVKSFNVACNYKFFSFLVSHKFEDGDSIVGSIFSDNAVKNAMCSYVKKEYGAEHLKNSNSLHFQTLQRVRHWPKHNDHLHLRLKCAPNKLFSKCRDALPLPPEVGTGCK